MAGVGRLRRRAIASPRLMSRVRRWGRLGCCMAWAIPLGSLLCDRWDLDAVTVVQIRWFQIARIAARFSGLELTALPGLFAIALAFEWSQTDKTQIHEGQPSNSRRMGRARPLRVTPPMRAGLLHLGG